MAVQARYDVSGCPRTSFKSGTAFGTLLDNRLERMHGGRLII